jgi:hypothetical protein
MRNAGWWTILTAKNVCSGRISRSQAVVEARPRTFALEHGELLARRENLQTKTTASTCGDDLRRAEPRLLPASKLADFTR